MCSVIAHRLEQHRIAREEDEEALQMIGKRAFFLVRDRGELLRREPFRHQFMQPAAHEVRLAAEQSRGSCASSRVVAQRLAVELD